MGLPSYLVDPVRYSWIICRLALPTLRLQDNIQIIIKTNTTTSPVSHFTIT
jgi:hypothetical protein